MLLKSVFALALLTVPATAASAAAPVFGKVVAIGGSASDIALDESRGLLYVANMGASVIDVMSTADNTIQSSAIKVLPFPGAIALSPDAKYLLVAHYCNGGPTAPTCANAITSLHLTDNSRQIFSLTNPPLGLAFLKSGQALVITTTAILFLDPATGETQPFQTIASIAETLPVPFATFPGQVLQAALVTSSDGNTVWGIASAGTASQLVFQFTAATSAISASIYVSSPVLLPRISSAADGSYAMIGYALLGAGGILKGRYPDAIADINITGSAVDSVNKIIYAQFPDANQPGGPAVGSATATRLPAMLIMDSDNLTFRDRISIPEDMVGRAILNAAATVMYVVSESGVMILPVGALNTYHRLAAQEDLIAALSTDFCSRSVVPQSLTITDPGGLPTDFAVTTTQAGVTISPAGGTTPATVQITVDPTMIPDLGGTTAIYLKLTSKTAVNWPKPVRLLVNHSDPGGHGMITSQPGVLSDILADQARNRFYVLRQDMNQVQVFYGTTPTPVATLRTATSPTMMAMTGDLKHLLVGHDDSQLITVYDLDSLQTLTPILMPGGHFARSIAASNAATLVLARNEGGAPAGIIDSINFGSNTAAPLVSLGIFTNDVSPTGVLGSSPGGGNVLLAMPDGTVALYTASEDTFVNSRHDLTALSGAFAVSDYGSFVVGNWMLNTSLVPSGLVNIAAQPTSGFTFVDQGGFMASAASASSAGALLRTVSPVTGVVAPITVSEAPLLPTAGDASVLLGGYGTYGSGSNSLHALNSFTRTVAPMLVLGMTAVLSTSGFTIVASSYPAPVISALITGVTSAADGSSQVAPGGLISIYGQNLSSGTLPAGATPLPSELAGSCLVVNGTPVPLLFVSPGQINAQLPFNVLGSATLAIHTSTGISNNFLFTIQPTAPGVFMTGFAGPETGFATIYRDDNNQLVTATNPIHPGSLVTIYLTGMGQTSPTVAAGEQAPLNPLAFALVQPVVTLGGAALSVTYAGLTPGEVGVYQINVTVPSRVPEGLAIPLVITQGLGVATLNVRVVN